MVNSKERQLIECIAKGMTTKAMSKVLDCPVSTIETYRHRLFRKLDVVNAPQLVSWSYQNGVLKIE